MPPVFRGLVVREDNDTIARHHDVGALGLKHFATTVDSVMHIKIGGGSSITRHSNTSPLANDIQRQYCGMFNRHVFSFLPNELLVFGLTCASDFPSCRGTASSAELLLLGEDFLSPSYYRKGDWGRV